MKLRTRHVSEFRSRVQTLDASLPNLLTACKNWMDAVDYNYGAESTSYRREELVKQLDKFRENIGELYDFMAERGLRDIDAGIEVGVDNGT